MNRLHVSRRSRWVIALMAVAVLIVAWAFSQSEPFPGGSGARLVDWERFYVQKPEIFEVYELAGTPRPHIENALRENGYHGGNGAMRKKDELVLIREGAYLSTTAYFDLPPRANTTPKEGYLTITMIREDNTVLVKLIERILTW